MHFHIRNQSKPLSLMKCGPPQLSKRGGGKLVNGEKVSDMYQIHCCWQLGPGKVTFSRIPCNCGPCKETIRKKWVPTPDPHDQPIFQAVKNCKYKSILGDRNNCFFCEVKQRQKKRQIMKTTLMMLLICIGG